VQKQFKAHLDEHLTFLQGKKLLVACSGGLDSVVLTHLLHTLGYELGLAHCNFSLRGKESDEDENFVIDLAKKLSVAVYSETFDTKQFMVAHNVSTQMAARELRYRWFEEIRKDFKYDYIVTAHHADDQLETFLINLARGTGIRGLSGIPERTETLVRPLLPFSRDAILTYAKSNDYYWREDSSNSETKYVRNNLRHEVIPKLKDASKNLLSMLLKTQAHLRASEHLIEDYMALVFNLAVTENFDGYSIHIQKLKELPNTDALLYELLHPFGFTDHTSVIDLLTTQSGKQILSSSHRLVKDRDVLLLTTIPSEENTETATITTGTKEIEAPVHLKIQQANEVKQRHKNHIFVDRDTLTFPLTVRPWREGDVFYPFGMKGKKKLSKFFKDEKLSLVAKEKMYVLCSGNDIVWVIGMRPDDRFKVTPTTTKILKITRSTP